MRVLIVAQDKLTAEAIRRALRYAPTCRVIGYVSTERANAAIIADALPDVIVIDEPAGAADLTARVRELRSARGTAKLVLLTADMDRARLADLSAAGIDAAVDRNAPAASVGMLVREVAAGHVYHAFGPAASSAAVPDAADGLTAREREILGLVAAGLPNGQIAARLWVTEQTVKFHLSNIYRKLGLANRTQASHYAHTHGLIEPAVAQPVPVAA
jgi:DNA-binding NarL/FixJ family response regulator